MTGLGLTRADVDPDPSLQWCLVSDERLEITTRRDTARPTTAFFGKTVEVWGCGGLGSWLAEFIGRSGASKFGASGQGRRHPGTPGEAELHRA